MGTSNLVLSKGAMRPYLFLNSIVCLNFNYFIINSIDEDLPMSFLTLVGLKKALKYVEENKTSIRVHKFEPRKGFFIIPKDVAEDDAYHLFLIQKFEPKLIDRFTDELTMLSVNGQELLDILSDDVYVENLRNQIKKLGYTSPSDRQIYKLLKEQMNSYSTNNCNTPSYVINLIDPAIEKKIQEIGVTNSIEQDMVMLDKVELSEDKIHKKNKKDN